VAGQVAVSLVLVVFAGLFLGTMRNLWNQQTGYNRHNVLMFSVDAGLIGKRGVPAADTYRKILDTLTAMPQVESASASLVRPVDEAYHISMVLAIGDRQYPDQQGIRIATNAIAPEYFRTLGVALLAGREFDASDNVDAAKTAVISETMARRRFPNQNPLGQRITLAERNNVRTIVGVAADVRYANIKDAPRDVVYMPLFQEERPGSPSFEIRYRGMPADALAAMRAGIAAADPGLTPFRIKTLETQTEESLSRETVLAMLTTYGGAFAVLLACVGLYGLMMYSVAQRTGELGLRMALGAQPRNVRWMVLRENAATVLIGLAAGVAGSLAATRLVQSQLYGVLPNDATTFAVSVATMLVMALAAAYVPAFRASRIDPIRALRHE
jgi:predicted permease